MTVVYRESIPIYETECDECHSVIRYRKAEARPNQGYINCPVCGVPIRALAVNPVTVLDDEEQIKRDASNADRIRSQSDEGLADWLVAQSPGGICPGEKLYNEACLFTKCKDCWLGWLKEECK